MARSANLPAPFKGIDQLTPVAALSSPFCETLLNYNTTGAGIELRNGDSVFSDVPNTGGVTEHDIRGLFTFQNQAIVASKTDLGLKYYIGDKNTPLAFAANSTGGVSTSVLFSFEYMGYIWFTKENGGFLDKFDGTTWSAIGFTGASSAIGGVAYRNRAYFYQGTTIYFSNVQAISGALSSIDIASVLNITSNIVLLGSMTTGDDIEAENLFVIATQAGEVLFYSGSYPNGSDWRIRGRGKLPTIISFHPIYYNGDILIMTVSGLYSLRLLLRTGSEKIGNLILSKEVQKTWEEIYGHLQGAPDGNFGVFWEAKNRIVISSALVPDGSGGYEAGNFFFIYDVLREAWTTHKSAQFNENYPSGFICVLNEDLLISPPDDAWSEAVIWSKEGASDFQDVNLDGTKEDYYYEMLSAPIPFPKTAVYEASLIEPILASDLYSETNWNLVADFGRQTTGDQTTNAGVSTVSKPAVNVGIQNITYVQVKVSGTTTQDKSVGLVLYSYNILYNAGEEGSR